MGCGLVSHDEESVCNLRCYCCNSLEHVSTSKLCSEYIRQGRLKEIMPLKNKIFDEANEFVPQLSNKDFPELSRSDIVEVGERR